MNTNKPIIGISATTMNISGFDSIYLHYSYAESIMAAGGIPVVLPSGPAGLTEGMVELCDGICLSGGEDVDPYYFGAEPHPKLGKVVPDRDEAELGMIRHARLRGIPIFGICRGIQVLNIALGGTIIQDIESERPKSIKHTQLAPRGSASHSISIDRNSRLFRAAGRDVIRVNSFHHQAIEKIADELVVTASATDGIIEAVESRDFSKGWMSAVQWHPEDMAKTDEVMNALFAEFVSECIKWRSLSKGEPA
ncbi:gamma-glutamyl-gamma-aminobutyrate hydrolase family protein [Peribacillus sp. SCS-37]|uniref:gamma-glutamyl-gamma-aminobutyrate hydrolase family protein n=1 Tax=Paraperibacillus esterisolvens TaxID=3115296 RepID=UPI0039069746